jgi:hypothetical protein
MKLRVIVQVERALSIESHVIPIYIYIYVYVDANAWRILPALGGADECQIYTSLTHRE